MVLHWEKLQSKKVKLERQVVTQHYYCLSYIGPTVYNVQWLDRKIKKQKNWFVFNTIETSFSMVSYSWQPIIHHKTHCVWHKHGYFHCKSGSYYLFTLCTFIPAF